MTLQATLYRFNTGKEVLWIGVFSGDSETHMHTHSHKNHLQVDLIFRTPGPRNLSICSHSILRLGKGLCKRPPLGLQLHISRGATPKATFFLVKETKIRRKCVEKENLPTILNSEHYEFLSLVFVPLQSKPLCLCMCPPTPATPSRTGIISPSQHKSEEPEPTSGLMLPLCLSFTCSLTHSFFH